MKKLAVLALVAALAMVPAAAMAIGSSCDNAVDWGWHSTYWNIQCLWDLLTGWL